MESSHRLCLFGHGRPPALEIYVVGRHRHPWFLPLLLDDMTLHGALRDWKPGHPELHRATALSGSLSELQFLDSRHQKGYIEPESVERDQVLVTVQPSTDGLEVDLAHQTTMIGPSGFGPIGVGAGLGGLGGLGGFLIDVGSA